jgi:uncharacterized OB-fold protein
MLPMSQEATAAGYLPTGMPLPAPMPDGLDAPFWEAVRGHHLVVQRCTRCRTFQMLPEWTCHACRSFDLSWEPVSGRGAVFSWVRVWYPAHPALAEACPYLVVVVELADAAGVRIVGNLLGDAEQPVVIGAPVEAVFEDHPDDGVTLVQWRLLS